MASISESGKSSSIGRQASSSDSEDDVSYGDKVCAKLNSLRKRGFLCDVTLISNGKSFPALKAILVSYSSFFKVMFLGHSSYKDKSTVTLNNVEPDVLKIILDFMYSGDLDFHEGYITDILEASLFMLIPEVVKECCLLLKNNLRLENCLNRWQYIRRLSALSHRTEELKYLTELQNFSKKYILRSFKLLWKQNQFFQLSSDEVIEIIGNNALKVTNEEMVLLSVVMWIKEQNRPEYAEKVLPHVRLALLDRYYFDDTIRPVGHLLNSPLCQRILNKAIDYQSLVHRRKELESPLSRSRFFHSSTYAIRVYFDPTASKQRTSVFLTEDGKILRKERWSGHYIQPVNHNLLVWDNKKLSLKIYNVDASNRKANATPLTPQEKNKYFWKDFGPLPTPRENIGFGELDGKFYAIGGSYLNSRTPSNVIEQCNLSTKVWRKVTALPVGVSGPLVASLGGNLYIAGGTTGHGLNAPLTSVMWYCPRMNSTGTFVQLPEKYVCFDLRALNRKLYVYLQCCRTYKKALFSLDTRKAVWKRCAGMNHLCKKRGFVTMNGYFYGISRRSDGVKIIERYSPWTDSWMDFAMFPDFSPSLLIGPFPFKSKRKVAEGDETVVTMLNDFSANDDVLLYLEENNMNL